MPTLRQMIDGRTVMGAAPPPKAPKPPSGGKGEAPGGESGFQAPMGAKPAGSKTGSPAANHVSTHVQDPYSATKAITDRLNQAQMQYELEKHNANMMLEPVRQVVDGISQQHGLMTTKPLASQNQNNPDVALGMDPNSGQPVGLGATPGQMNQNRPSQVGSQPGMPPGTFPSQSVVPNKMGMPGPGMGMPGSQAGVPGAMIPGQKPPMPSGWQGPQAPPGGQFNPSAPKPGGAGQLPGANGPGDPSVQKPIKKAQGKSGSSSGNSKGKVNIAVHADAKTPSMAPSPLSAQMGVASLRSCDYAKKMDARDFSDPRREKLAKKGDAMPGGGFPIVNREDLANAKQAIGRAKNRAATIRHINERAKALGAPGFGKTVKSYGTSEGVQKAWDSRGRGKKSGDDSHFGPGGVYKNPDVKKYGPGQHFGPGGVYDNPNVKSYPASKTASKPDPNERFGYGVDEPEPKQRKFGEGGKSQEPWGFDAAKMKMKKMKGGVFKPKHR